MGGTWLRGQEIAQEVDVSPDGNAREPRAGPVQADVLVHQVAVGDPDSLPDLLLPPAVEPITRARSPAMTREPLPGLALEKVLGLPIVGVNDDGKAGTQPAFDVSDGLARDPPRNRAPDYAGPQKGLA